MSKPSWSELSMDQKNEFVELLQKDVTGLKKTVAKLGEIKIRNGAPFLNQKQKAAREELETVEAAIDWLMIGLTTSLTENHLREPEITQLKDALAHLQNDQQVLSDLLSRERAAHAETGAVAASRGRMIEDLSSQVVKLEGDVSSISSVAGTWKKHSENLDSKLKAAENHLLALNPPKEPVVPIAWPCERVHITHWALYAIMVVAGLAGAVVVAICT